MTLDNLKEFMADCIEARIPWPKDTMKVVISDFHQVVPEEHHKTQNLEFTHRVGPIGAKVIILPEPKN